MKGIREPRLLMVVLLVLGMAVGQSTAFVECYGKCFFSCMQDNKGLCECLKSCFGKCILPAATFQTSAHEEKLGFCKLGCAFSLCSKLSTKQNPNAENVGNCVGSCSKKCNMSYSLA